MNSLKVKIFRHVAMNSHIKFVRFTTKIRKQGIYGHAFLTLVIIPQCHSFVILVIKPPFYLPNSSPVEYLCTHTQLAGIYRVTNFPPSPDNSLIFLLCTWPVNLLHVSSITHMCGIFARIIMTFKKKSWL